MKANEIIIATWQRSDRHWVTFSLDLPRVLFERGVVRRERTKAGSVLTFFSYLSSFI